ncbi:MAG: ABC transporter permease, partial [Promethearchaeota archaeon]
KDKLSIFVLFALPLLIIIPVGEAEPALKETPVVWVIDQDNTHYSNALVDELVKNSTSTGLEISQIECFTSRDDNVTLEEAQALLPTEFLSAYIIIPEGFEDSLIANKSASVEMHVDGMEYVNQLLTQMTVLERVLNFQIDYQVFNSETLYFPVMRPEEFQTIILVAAPILSGFALFATLNLVSSQAIVADVPLKRMLLSPAMKSEVVLAKNIAYSIFGGLLTLLCMMIFRWGYSVLVQSTFIELFVALMITVGLGVSLGILFSTIATSRLQAAQLFLFSFIMQMLLVNQLRIPGVVDYMPLELHRDLFIKLAYRGLSLRQCAGVVTKMLAEYVAFIGVSLVLYARKREEV